MPMLYDDKVRILVIDDSEVIQSLFKSFLSDYNIEVITCSDGLEGIQKAIEYRPKLIFVDIMMPNLDGLRMIKIIKILDDLKNIPVIVVSGHTDKKNVIAAVEAGAVHVISKPLSKKVLLKGIREALGDDFLINIKKEKSLSSSAKKEILESMKKFFLANVPQKLKIFEESLNAKNINLLKTVAHELKGSSGTLGFNIISNICNSIEELLNEENIDWIEIYSKYQDLIHELEVLEILNSK
ncbi:MAG: response regulator [Melioribacter sp.]|uniref:Hpt domain-containing response regulator n=1 Tax=Rosettibacter primus TaxID=3111523 RepID=UPI00247C6805|nr:response regulator [Melioribacter sp.]